MSDKKEVAPIKAIFIDAIKREVREITLKEGGSYKECYRLLKMPGPGPLVDDINTVRIDGSPLLGAHYIYVDGEGLLKDPEHFFWWRGFPHALAGHGIVVHINQEGDTDDLDDIDIEKVRANIKWARLKVHGFVTTQRRQDIFGRDGLVITNRAVLTERDSKRTADDARREIAEHLGLPIEAVDWVSLDEAAAMNEGGSEPTNDDDQQ